MRYLMHTIGDDSTPLPPPNPELMVEMGKLMEEVSKAGVLLERAAECSRPKAPSPVSS